MKNVFTQLSLILFSGSLLAQVGINTTDPKTTMDVSAKRDISGNILDNNKTLGLQAPRISRAELTLNTATYGTEQRGALIYITDITGGNTTGQRVNITNIGYYYFDGALWQNLNGSTSSNQNIYNANGTLQDNRTVSQAANSLSFTSAATTGANQFSVDGSTFSINTVNNAVGIGTIAPSNSLHIVSASNPLRMEGVTSGNPNTDKLVVIDGSGVIKSINTLSQLGVPNPAIFSLLTAQNNFLTSQGAGSASSVPMTELKNTISNLTYNAANRQITMPPGLYQMTFVYEGTHNATGCTLSSYYVDFPTGNKVGDFQRIHSTSAHNQGGGSSHGGTITFTTQITGARPWTIELGRGQSGNCSGAGMTLAANSTQLLIFRIGD